MDHLIRSKIIDLFVKQIWPEGKAHVNINGQYQYFLQQGKILYKKNPKWFLGLYGDDPCGYSIMLVHSHKDPWGKEQHEAISFNLTSLPFLIFKKNKAVGVSDKKLKELHSSLPEIIQVDVESLKEFNRILASYDKFKEI